jgi:hypothetical protein
MIGMKPLTSGSPSLKIALITDEICWQLYARQSSQSSNGSILRLFSNIIVYVGQEQPEKALIYLNFFQSFSIDIRNVRTTISGVARANM